MNSMRLLVLVTCLAVPLGGVCLGGSLDMKWDPGREECTPADARTQAHAFDESTIIIRQNPCVDYEANLLYLLIGEREALLLDSGAVDGPAGAPVAEIVRGYLQRAGGAPLPLLVAHTHRHLDHRAGDALLAMLPGARVVPIESAPVRAFYGFTDWPNGSARIDLGNRIVEVIPAPGHHEDHVVFYDARTRLLFTGDFLLPGRLIVDDLDAYRASAQRLVEFVKTHPVSHVFGAHIELDATGEVYSAGATHHPNERPLALGVADLDALPTALADFNGFYSRHPNFIVVNPLRNLLVLAAGGLLVLALAAWGARRLWRRRRAT